MVFTILMISIGACTPEIAKRKQFSHSLLALLQSLERGLDNLDRVAMLHSNRREDFAYL